MIMIAMMMVRSIINSCACAACVDSGMFNRSVVHDAGVLVAAVLFCYGVANKAVVVSP